MTNNEPAPLSHNVSTQQPFNPNGQQPRSGVRQDKSTSKRDRKASTQPASLVKPVRSHELRRNSPRAQNHSTTNRRTVPLTLWVKPRVKAEVERIAEMESISISATAGALLENAIRQNLSTQHMALYEPIIEKAIAKHMRGISTRLAWLLVRVAFDSGQSRSLVTNILGRQPGVTPDILKTILDSSSKTAKGNITRKTPQLAELIEAVEQWMSAEEGEKQTYA